MRVQFFILGAIVALTFGALSVTSLTPVGSHSKAATAAATHSPEAATTDSATTDADANAAPDVDTSPSAHPCNHGFYMSQVAHEHKGGKFVSSVAQSDLGKNGDCSKPVPTPTPTPTPTK